MARGERKNPKMAEYEEQLRRAEALLGDEQKKPEPRAAEESPEEVLRREEAFSVPDEMAEPEETPEQIRVRLERELGVASEKKEAPRAAPTEEKPGKLRPEQKAGLESKVRAYEKMIAEEEAQIDRVTQEMQLSEGARRELGKHLPQMRETLRRMKDELRRDEGEEPGLTP